jgi:inorganic triphosphatase YgiF
VTTTHREVEDKYAVSEDAALPSLESLPGVYAVSAPVEHDLEATYFDTSDLRLAAAGITLRRRTGGDDAGWHLKLPAFGARDEMQLPLDEGTTAVPSQFRDTLQGVVRHAPLNSVATVRTRRTMQRLLDGDGRVLAEVADDRVSGTDQDTGVATAWREWEVELVKGDDTLLEAAADLLRGVGATPSRAPSKLVRTLDRRIPHRGGATPAQHRTAPAGRIVHGRLADQVTQLRRLDPLVRRDVPDAVHKSRVAIRRLRSALATFRPLLNRGVTDPLRDELKWLGGVLGDARDAEVMHERLRDMLSAEAPRAVRGDVLARVDR